jgi:choline kinase
MTNVVIPMAGAGSRFANAGYEVPKPLIEVEGLTMVNKSIWSSAQGGRYIFIVQAEHNKKYNLSEILPPLTPSLDVVIIEVDEVTEGAAASVLLAKEYINNDEILIICDSDILVDYDPNAFLMDAGAGRNGLDGSIAVFRGEGDEWSYVRTDRDGYATGISEKLKTSEYACAGIYYWGSGSLFVECAEEMISKDIRVNGEFYVAPAYNEAISKGKRVGIYEVDSFTSLGTPEHLDAYLKSKEVL